jgi:hypothetical protein
MVEISLYGSGEGSGWVTAPGYSTTAFSDSRPIGCAYVQFPRGPCGGDFKVRGARSRSQRGGEQGGVEVGAVCRRTSAGGSGGGHRSGSGSALFVG